MIVETSLFGNFKQTEDSKVLIIPVPYEYTTSYVRGTKEGPQAVLNASVHLEQFDDELWTDINNIGINTSNFVNCEFVKDKSREPFIEVEAQVREAVIKGSLPVVIGGEHSISYGSIKAIYDLYPDLSVLHFGAHSDLKSVCKQNKFNHSCTMRRIIELMPDLTVIQTGIRNISREETVWLEENNPNIDMFFARDKNRWTIADILGSLKKNVYITFNFNALDSGIMPSVSRPEPGGLSWEQAIDILKNVCTFKDVVGMDFVELSPVTNLHAPDFLACKLIYKTIGYSFARELGAFEDSETALVTSRGVARNASTREL